jgi:hypothetical protein
MYNGRWVGKTTYICKTVQVTPLFLKLAASRWAQHFLSFVKDQSSLSTYQRSALSSLALLLEDIGYYISIQQATTH